MVSVTVSLKGKAPIKLDFAGKEANDVTIKEVKTAVQAKVPKLVRNRQRITLPVDGKKPSPLVDEAKTLADYGVTDGTTLRLKDLGKQVGPIFLNPLFLHLAPLIWGKFQPSALQLGVRNMVVLHFVKRFLESAFLHDFSRATVPLSFVIRNCAYYWGICGLLIGLTLYRPANGALALRTSLLNSSSWLTLWTGVWAIAELLNLRSHVHLRSLRVPAGQPRKYPTSLGFGQIVCANYFYEIVGVIAWVAVTGFDIGTVVYLCIGSYFMFIWAGQKAARYKKEMDPKIFPGRRWKVMPFIY